MNNTINHKCPCCGYTTEYDWINNGEQFETVIIQGNEPFVVIESDAYSFKTDVERKVIVLQQERIVVVLRVMRSKARLFLN